MQPGLACIRATSESSTFIVPCRPNVVEPDIVDGHHVGMVQRGGQSGFVATSVAVPRCSPAAPEESPTPPDGQHALLDHLDGILNYCRTKVPLGVVEAVNGNIKSLLRRGRGYKNLHYLLLKAQRMAATRTEFVVFQKAA